jgi:hypothetical protein
MKETNVTLGVITTISAAITLLITIAVAGQCCSELIVQSAYAQTTWTITLGEPFFEEKGKITGQKPIGDTLMNVYPFLCCFSPCTPHHYQIHNNFF